MHIIQINNDQDRKSTFFPFFSKSEDLATRQRQKDLEFKVSLSYLMSLNWQDGSVGKSVLSKQDYQLEFDTWSP